MSTMTIRAGYSPVMTLVRELSASRKQYNDHPGTRRPVLQAARTPAPAAATPRYTDPSQDFDAERWDGLA